MEEEFKLDNEETEVVQEQSNENKKVNISFSANSIGILASAIALGILVLLKIICCFKLNATLIGVFSIFILIFATVGVILNYVYSKKSLEMWLSVIMLATALLTTGVGF